MDVKTEKAIRLIVDVAIKSFSEGFEFRHFSEKDNPDGTINTKKNNCFIQLLGNEFVFYSAFIRSFDSSFGHVLESIGNNIAKYSYTTNKTIDSFILTEQTQHISNLVDKYEDHLADPEERHYKSFFALIPTNIESFKTTHECDHWFYNEKNKTHYLVELKSGGDLDNKKAKSEKIALLKEYFMLKNIIPKDQNVVIKFATAYNKNGEDKEWHQSNVERFFSKEELLIGKEYWNFVCDDEKGFEIILDQYSKSSHYIKTSIKKIKELYNCN